MPFHCYMNSSTDRRRGSTYRRVPRIQERPLHHGCLILRSQRVALLRRDARIYPDTMPGDAAATNRAAPRFDAIGWFWPGFPTPHGQVMSCLPIVWRHPWTPFQDERAIDAILKGRAAQEVAMSYRSAPGRPDLTSGPSLNRSSPRRQEGDEDHEQSGGNNGHPNNKGNISRSHHLPSSKVSPPNAHACAGVRVSR